MKAKKFQHALEKLNRREVGQVALDLYQKLPEALQQSVTHALVLGTPTPVFPKAMDAANNLLKHIQHFARQVRRQYYNYPNTIVSKNLQVQWDAPIKQWLKWLIEDPPFALDASEKALALEELYQLLCDASDMAYFQTEDVFGAFPYAQVDLYKILLRNWAVAETPMGALQRGLDVLLYNALNLSTLYADLMEVYIQELGQATAWQQAIVYAKDLLMKDGIDVPKQEQGMLQQMFYSKARGQQIDRHNNLVELIFRLYCHLDTHSMGAQFFQAYHCEPNPEAKLYTLVGLLLAFEQKQLVDDYLKQAKKERLILRPSLEAMVSGRNP